MASATATVLASPSLYSATSTASDEPMRMMASRSLLPCSTVATSRRWIGTPLSVVISMSRICCRLANWFTVRTR